MTSRGIGGAVGLGRLPCASSLKSWKASAGRSLSPDVAGNGAQGASRKPAKAKKLLRAHRPYFKSLTIYLSATTFPVKALNWISFFKKGTTFMGTPWEYFRF